MSHRISINREPDIISAVTVAYTEMSNSPYSILEKQQIIVTISELCKNILFHSNSTGYVFIERIQKGIRITAIDDGVGIASIEDVINGIKNPHSKGLGLGLTGVKQMMDVFMIESPEQGGTKVIVEKWYGRIPSTKLTLFEGRKSTE
ncbi:ATP-binding protein [Bacillus pinisoli]|uniref:ATP-binding protein n=1 Tax=Bacillus pinisoli TaxID=2901866 RepID=UPI001FF3DA7B|nr:ATP-binding protein [Bacillus pinisoli]